MDKDLNKIFRGTRLRSADPLFKDQLLSRMKKELVPMKKTVIPWFQPNWIAYMNLALILIIAVSLVVVFYPIPAPPAVNFQAAEATRGDRFASLFRPGYYRMMNLANRGGMKQLGYNTETGTIPAGNTE